MAGRADILLAKVLIKTERAKKHILDLENIATASLATGVSLLMNSKGEYFGPEPTRTFNVEVICTAGDAIHNLRSALDHLAWNLAHWEGTIPGIRCGFPIGKELVNYESIKSRMVAGMSPEAKQAIDNLRPYKGGNEPLWMIHHLDIIDKHRHLYVFPYQNLFSASTISGLFGTVTNEPAHFLGIFDGDLEGEYESPGQPTTSEFEISNMKPLIPTLHELLVFTEDLIKNFAPLLKTTKA
jgi:hypothetical protein